MLNISSQSCTKVELWDLIVCIAVIGEKFCAMTLTCDGQYRTCLRYFHKLRCIKIFMLIDRLLLSYGAKTWKHGNTETQKHRNTHRL